MAWGYVERKTLKEIFNDKENTSARIPIINYKEKEDENGKLHKTTKMATINALIFNEAKKVAKPFYTDFTAKRADKDTLILDGKINDVDGCVDALCNAFRNKDGNNELRDLIANTAKYGDILKFALKESEMEKRKGFATPKLYLKSNYYTTFASRQMVNEFFKEVMDNIYYSDDYVMTRIKFGIEYSPEYYQKREDWRRKVNYRGEYTNGEN